MIQIKRELELPLSFVTFPRVTNNATAPAPSTDPDDWFSPRRFALLLALLICASFPDVIVGGRTFFHRDYAVFGYPLAFHYRESFWRGQFPMWTPLSYCGLPFLAQWNTMTLYPLSLFYLLLPISWSLGVFCLGHFYLAGLGMYFLTVRWTQNRFAAVVAGLAYTFNAVMLNALMWPNNIAALAWLPFVVLTTERAWREGGARNIVMAAFVGAMQMLSGAPEVILLTWLFLGALLLLEMWQDRAMRARMPLRFAGAVVLVAGLTAAQMLPFLDLLHASQRHEGFADSTWAMPLWGWADFLVPLFRAQPTALGVYAQPGQYWIGSYYLGVGVVALALLAAWQVKQPRVRLLAWCTLVCLVMALGERGVVYDVLSRVLPVLSFMRFPIKFIILPTFLIPLLAGFFVAHCRYIPSEAWPRVRRSLIVVSVIFVIAMLLIVLAAYQFPMKNTVAPVVAMQSGLTRVVLLALILGAVAVACRAREPRRQVLSCFGVALLVWLDPLTMGPRPNSTVPRWVYTPGLAARESGMTPVPHVGDSRPMLSAEAEGNVNVAQLTNAVDTVVYSRLALFGNANLLDDIPKVIGSYSLYFRELGDVFRVLYGTNKPPPGLMDFLAVSQVNAPGKVTQWIFRPTHLPWVTGGQKPVFADAQGTLRALGEGNFNPRKEVYLPEADRGRVTVSNSSSPQIITPEFTAQRVRIETEAAQPALVVIAQSFYHNWHAYVDGKPTTLLRANHAFQALEIPAGKHEVVLRYEDRMFRLGTVISGIAVIACVLFWLRGRKRTETTTEHHQGLANR